MKNSFEYGLSLKFVSNEKFLGLLEMRVGKLSKLKISLLNGFNRPFEELYLNKNWFVCIYIGLQVIAYKNWSHDK